MFDVTMMYGIVCTDNDNNNNTAEKNCTQKIWAHARDREKKRRMCTTDKYFMADFYEHVKPMSEKQTKASKHPGVDNHIARN